MLTQTSETAIKALIYLALYATEEPIPPREIAEKIDASPTYMAKITRMLVKANILRSQRGSLGGVKFSRDPDSVTLLNVVEACQGLMIGNYCDAMTEHPDPVCAFHQAMMEIHQATTSVLVRWTIGDLARRPTPAEGNVSCKINILLPEECTNKECAAGVMANKANGAS